MADDFETQFSPAEEALWDDVMAGINYTTDATAEALYHAAFFDFEGDYTSDERHAIQEAFYDYMSEYYDIDWQEEFDWEAYRESYGEVAA